MFQIKLQRKIKHILFALHLFTRLAISEIVKENKLFTV
jgi:hypothetical protein